MFLFIQKQFKIFYKIYLIYKAFQPETFKNKILLILPWKEVQEDGRKKAKWDGNGKEKNLEKKNTNVK